MGPRGLFKAEGGEAELPEPVEKAPHQITEHKGATSGTQAQAGQEGLALPGGSWSHPRRGEPKRPLPRPPCNFRWGC